MIRCLKLSIIIVVLFLVACNADNHDVSSEISGQVLIWHTWEGNEEVVLNKILNNFTELYPDVTIVAESFPAEELEEAFVNNAKLGLGPDVVIAPSDWVKRLSQNGLIVDIQAQNVETDEYLTGALSTLQNEDSLLGIPLSLNTFALFYNKNLLNSKVAADSATATLLELVQEQKQIITDTERLQALDNLLVQIETSSELTETIEPASDLESLLQQAKLGQKVAMPSDFYGAFWGIQAFGGQLFDDEGRLILNQGGFANWLGWLKQAQANPNIFLNRRTDTLRDLFTSGSATYYIGDSRELQMLQEAMGTDVVGVVRLPGQQNKSAGPFLKVDAMMFSKASAADTRAASLRLAEYLTSAEQQQELALLAGRLPINKRVTIDPRISPIVAELIAQSRTAVPIPLEDLEKFGDVTTFGDDYYAQVLDGETTVVEAANLLTKQVNDKFNIDTQVTNIVADCDLGGSIDVWHPWVEVEEEVLTQITNKFMLRCPEANVNLRYINGAELLDQYLKAVNSEEQPDLILGNNQWIADLASAELIRNVEEDIDGEFLQRYRAVVEQSARYQEGLYGIPINMDLMALYYNKTLVEDPPVVLDDVLTLASADTPFAIPLGFIESYWGISAFGLSDGGALFDEEGRFAIGVVGLPEWLDWLQTAGNQSGIVLSNDTELLTSRFTEQEVAYLVGSASQLGEIQAELDADSLGLIPLPSGSPLLFVDMLMVNALSGEDEQALALRFAQFMTDVENQNLLMLQAGQVPINVNVDTVVQPVIHGFVEQAGSVVVIPNISQMEPVFQWGDLVYEQVFEGEIAPLDAVGNFISNVDATNGFEVVEADIPIEEGCTDEGEVSLWHDWSEPEALAWQEVISGFVEICPNIQILTMQIPTVDLTRQLTSTLQADSDLLPPDFFIASHDQLDLYREAGLVRNIAPLADNNLLVDFLPKALTAVSTDEEIYGLPQTLRLPALYYRSDLVAEPAITFDGLLSQVVGDYKIGMPTSFFNMLWGASAYDCVPCQTGNFLNDQGDLALTNADITNWVSWLESMQAIGNVTFSDDEELLASMFINGEIDYLVAGPAYLNGFQDALGIANVGVTVLPQSSEEQLSAPFLLVDAFMFFQETPEDQTRLALRFAEYALQSSNQTFLMQAANIVPVNDLALITADDAAMLAFIKELESSILYPDKKIFDLIVAEEPLYSAFDSLGNIRN